MGGGRSGAAGRIFRLWVIVLLPLAIYCGYQAFRQHTLIDYYRDYAKEVRSTIEAANKNGHQTLFDVDDASAAIRDAANSRELRNIYAALSAALLFFPLIALFLWRIIRWVWFG